ncbi:DUF3387 domain-containing protein [Hymenobacter sp. RP-2-7]|uniref:DUF3387 domain-containing protein n=1 Tax=Hymenobacter polaris TaxID=2682546 RepID=A0A7Y0AIS6_9BACT|nr:DUF3387 domain-containing protein [Hymenobacter polaris]
MAQELENQDACSSWLELTEVKPAFEDELRVSNSAVEGMGDEKLHAIACELVDRVRKNTSLDSQQQVTIPATAAATSAYRLLLNQVVAANVTSSASEISSPSARHTSTSSVGAV